MRAPSGTQPLDMTGIVVYNYLQKVTPSLALGMEGTAMMTGPRVDSSMTLVARHAAGNHVGIATLSAAKSQFSYFQQVRCRSFSFSLSLSPSLALLSSRSSSLPAPPPFPV